MARVPTEPGVPGIRSLFSFRPETGAPLQALAEALLRGPSPLSRGERELIAAVVSSGNACRFCTRSHAAFAAAQLEGGEALVDQACARPSEAPLSAKMKALLVVAEQTRQGGGSVTDEAIAAAREAGAGDVEIHDTVLIAAAFCMFNRYVDGLRAATPDDPASYRAMAAVILERGYVR